MALCACEHSEIDHVVANDMPGPKLVNDFRPCFKCDCMGYIPVPYPDAVLLKEQQPCFFCGKLTIWADINYQAPYCGNDDDAIDADLRRLNNQS